MIIMNPSLALLRPGPVRSLRGLIVLLVLAALSSCGILDQNLADNGETGVASDGSQINLKLVNTTSNTVVRSVDSYTTSLIKVKVSSPKVSFPENIIINFSTTVGTISPESGSALTNTAGEATVTLITSNTGGAGVISANANINGTDLSVSYNFSVTESRFQSGGDGTSGGDGLSGTDAPVDTTTPVVTAPAPNTVVIGTVEFTSVQPEVMALKGTGGQGLAESSIVTFRVVDEDGLPVANQVVNFSLNSTLGGLRIYPTSRVTDSSGKVSTFVYSGSVATTVRVTATTIVTATDGNNYEISTQSDKLVVSSGLPDQNSFSLAFSTFNPEGAEWVGSAISVTARVADQFNNFVPDGTAVYFTAEGGTIQPFCLTKKGGCSVEWVSGQPVPSDHRVTIMATAIGNESFVDMDADGYYTNADGEPFLDRNRNNVLDEPFTDTNGNNRFDEPFTDTSLDGNYDPGEAFVDHNNNGVYDGAGNNPAGETVFTDSNGNGNFDGSGRLPSGENYIDINGNAQFDGGGFSDLPEAYLDANENGQYDLGEYFVDSDGNGIFNTSGDGKFTGILCQPGSNCSTDRTIYIRQSGVIISSGSTALINVIGTTGTIYASNTVTPDTNTLNVSGTAASLNIRITDRAGQIMPSGTVVTVIVGEDTGNPTSTDIRDIFTVKNSYLAQDSSFFTIVSDEGTGSKPIKIKVVTPLGQESSVAFTLIE